MKTLIEFKTGDRIRIERVGCAPNFSQRLLALGLFDGADVEIIKNDQFGPLLLKVFDSKIALGRGEASQIYGKKI